LDTCPACSSHQRSQRQFGTPFATQHLAHGNQTQGCKPSNRCTPTAQSHLHSPKTFACLTTLATHLNPKPCCRFLKLAPHNMRYETLNQHLAQAGISAGKHSLWDVPLIMAAGSSGHSTSGGGGPNSSCGGSSRAGSSAGGSSMPGIEPSGGASSVLQPRQRPGASSPSSPHTHGGSSSAERRGGAATPKPVLLLPPEEFFPFVVPFRCVVFQGARCSSVMLSEPLPTASERSDVLCSVFQCVKLYGFCCCMVSATVYCEIKPPVVLPCLPSFLTFACPCSLAPALAHLYTGVPAVR
jgi:hypothetical protein